ncbi:MAG: hydroxymethylglutaryl-CoA lyase [Saprospiraceae bacterium]|nr:hydroxymethylglutaryl-CoA lyase [Saprospiraceae bacterium]
MRDIKLVECPRDAMQGLKTFVPTELKIKYLQKLLEVQFDTLDFGSFVSPKAIPQMQDTPEIVNQLDLTSSSTKLLAIVANLRGAVAACSFEQIRLVGYPFSISPTFQMRNTNANLSESSEQLKVILDQCLSNDKELLVYLSMAFGNPYGDSWNADIALEWTEYLKSLGVNKIALSDTIGVANPESIRYLFSNLIPKYPEIEFGAHFHTRPDSYEEKLEAAYASGCRKFDGAIKGFGGCPMAKDDLTGNMPTEKMISFFQSRNINCGIDLNKFHEALTYSSYIFETEPK